MSTLTVAMELPRDLLGILDVSRTQLETKLRELIALELFREGRISFGKGAELLGVPKQEFVHLLDQHEISYFAEAPEELGTEVATTEQQDTQQVWPRIKQRIAAQIPELLSMTDAEKRADFDRLSNLIAERMPYRTVEEFERAMRGDDYGLVGYRNTL